MSKTTFAAILFCFSYALLLAQVTEVSSAKFVMDIDGHKLKIPYYSNYDLLDDHPMVDKAIIVIHGTNRNADEYFRNMEMAAGKVSSKTAHTIIVSPQFLIEDDIDFHNLDDEHLYWTNGGWKAGSNSRDENSNPRPVRIPSYAVLDSLLLHLANQFPHLESLVLTGHSAGGQVAQRMAATSPMPDHLCEQFNINTRFVVANPSSYLYMDNQRKESGSTTRFSIPSTSCGDYNEWKYGLEDLFTYPAAMGADSIRKRYKRRLVTYLLGENDNNPNSSSLDTSCEADLQGNHRYERGEVYFNYLQHYYGASIKSNHDLVSVPNVGHDNFGMYNSPEGIQVLFERTSISCSSVVSSIQDQKEGNLAIYPNPAADLLNISWSPAIKRNTQAFIYDGQGRLVLAQPINISDELDISFLNTGVYFLMIQSGEIRAHQKFMVLK